MKHFRFGDKIETSLNLFFFIYFQGSEFSRFAFECHENSDPMKQIKSIDLIEALFTRTRFHLKPHQFRCGYAFRLHGADRVRCQNRVVLNTLSKSGAFSKRYGFIGRVNGETASI